MDFFKRHLETILNLGVEAAAARDRDMNDVAARVDSCRRDFVSFFDSFSAAPNDSARWCVDRVTILTLDKWRDSILRKHGFADAFVDLKNRENEKALPFFPTVCKQIDLLSGEEQFRAIIEGGLPEIFLTWVRKRPPKHILNPARIFLPPGDPGAPLAGG